MALLQGIKKLFGPLLGDLDCVSAVKEAMKLQVEACMWWRCFKGSRSCSALELQEVMELQVEAFMKEED
jgi:hypothetical protein